MAGLPRSKWAARYLAGSTLDQIARAAGVSHGTVRAHLQLIGVPRRPTGRPAGYRSPNSGWHKEAAALEAAGWTRSAIAARFGVTRAGVRWVLTRWRERQQAAAAE